MNQITSKYTKKASIEDEFHMDSPNVYYSISSRSHVNTEYHVYLLGDIQEPEHYAGLIGAFMQFGESDVVFVHINSSGGSYYCCLQLQNAIRSCEATTVAIIQGQCASAASAIALACDNVEVTPLAEMLVHNATYGFMGRASDNLEFAQFNSTQFKKWLESTYEGFLTYDEIIAVEKGKQHLMEAEEIKERLDSRNLWFEMLAEEEETELKLAMIEAKEELKKAKKEKKLSKKLSKKLAFDTVYE